METSKRLLRLRLFGSFTAKWSDGTTLSIRSAKQRALIALLATAADGVHTRAWIQDTLWSLSGQEHGRASLRRALSDLRTLLGTEFDTLFEVSNIDIRLRPECVETIGDRRDGEFLQGIDIPEEGFNAWLREKRQAGDHRGPHLPSMVAGKITPSVAVVPFLTSNGNQHERDFSDLMALEVTRSLSRSKIIDVISHLSSRQFEQRTLDLSAVQSTLGIDYLVYGTVRTENGRYQIDADFADAKTGRIHWTRPFKGKLSDVLSGDHGIVAELASQIGQTIIMASVELARSRPLPDVESHALLMSSITLMHNHVLASFSRARVQLEELISRAPGHSVLHAWLGKWYILSIAQGWSTNVIEDTAKAADCTGRALDLNPSCPFSLAIDGMVQNNSSRDISVASARFEDAIQIDPNSAIAWLLHARLHAFVGDGPKAVEYADRACALSPIDPHRYFFDNLSAAAHLANNDFEKALSLADRSLAANRRHTSTLRVRVVTLDLMGRHEEAREAALRLLRLEPGLTIKGYLNNHPAADYATGRTWADAMRRSGIPER